MKIREPSPFYLPHYQLQQVIATMKDNYKNVRICPFMDPKGSGAMGDRLHSDRYSPISSDLYYNDNLPQYCDLKLDPDILR